MELTLFVADVDASAAFYRAIGCDVVEWHEPRFRRHFDAAIGDTILQLFPSSERHSSSRNQLGFRVTSIAAVAAALNAICVDYEASVPHRLVTTDPDGNRVHLSEVH